MRLRRQLHLGACQMAAQKQQSAQLMLSPLLAARQRQRWAMLKQGVTG